MNAPTSPSPSPATLQQEPTAISAELLRPGLSTYYHTPQGWKKDETLLAQVDSGACFGLHFKCGTDLRHASIKCWHRCATVHVRASHGNA